MDYWDILNEWLCNNPIIIERKKNTAHPNFSSMIYPVDYGFIKNTHAMDKGGVDIFIGSDKGQKINGVMLVVDTLKHDSEIKVLYKCTLDEILKIERFLNESVYMKAIFIKYKMGIQ